MYMRQYLSHLREIPIRGTWLLLAVILVAGLPPTGCSHAPGAGRATLSDSHLSDSLGLVLLDCEVQWRTLLIPITLKGEPEAAFLLDLQQDRKPLLGKRKDGILVFQDVPPSSYRLTRVDHDYSLESDEKFHGLPRVLGDVFEFEKDNELLINVPPSGAIYLGRLIIKGERPCVLDSKYGNVLREDLIHRGWDYKLQRTRERERKIWSRALDKKWGRRWETQIRAQLAATE